VELRVLRGGKAQTLQVTPGPLQARLEDRVVAE
jgi:hypothetical protein